MNVYEELFNNVAGKVIDDAVDSKLGNVKDRTTLSTTYVWTCINKETHNNVIANLTFINKLGQRRRVPYDKLGDFCASQYVSNVIVNNGKPEMIGCSLFDLPNFKLNSMGGYDLHAPHDENWVYNKAIPYIQSQERLIQEDYRNKCLKTSNGTQVSSNITGNISNVAKSISDVKDISTATAVTAVTAAGTAAVAGTVAAGKAIYKQLNKGKIVEEQKNLCNRLKHYNELIHTLTLMKIKTNNYYTNNTNLLQYSVDVDINNETKNKLHNELRNFGVVGCIKKLYGGIEDCRSKAVALKINDLPLKLENVNFGTIDAYISRLQSDVDNLKQLHLQTKAIIDTNIAIKNQEENRILAEQQRQIEQNQLLNDINTEINNLQSILDSYMSMNINSDNVDFIPESLDRNQLLERLNTVSGLINNIDNFDTKNSLREKINHLNNISSELRQRILDFKHTSALQNKESITQDLTSAEQLLEEIILGNLGGNSSILDSINNINNTIAISKNKLNTLNDIDRDIIQNRIKTLEDKLIKNRYNIDRTSKQMEEQRVRLSELDLLIEQISNDIVGYSLSSEIQKHINNFKTSYNNKLKFISNSDSLEEYKTKLNNTVISLEEVLNAKIEEENMKLNEKLQAIDNFVQEIESKIIEIDNYNPETITEESLNRLQIQSIEYYEHSLREYKPSYNDLKYLTSKHSELNRKCRDKRTKYERILTNDRRAIDSLKQKQENIIRDINNLTSTSSKFSVNNLEDSINRLDSSYFRNDLQDKNMITTTVESLKHSLDEKKKSLGLN